MDQKTDAVVEKVRLVVVVEALTPVGAARAVPAVDRAEVRVKEQAAKDKRCKTREER